MKDPKISVIIPVYGVEKYIRNTIISVLNQTYSNYELILVDDETPDKSIDIAEKTLCSATVNYKILHKKNGGQGDTRNYGFSYATGDWILFLDSDDILQPCALQDLVNGMRLYPNCQIVFSNYQYVNIGNEFAPCEPFGKVIVYNHEQIQEAFLRRDKVVLAPGTLYNASWYRQKRLKFETNRFSEDILFVWNALLVCEEVVYVDKKLYNYLRHPQSVMTATKVSQLIKAYPFFKALEQRYQCCDKSSKLAKQFILPRWVFGVLNAGTQLCTFQEHTKLAMALEANKNFRKLLTYPSIKIKIMAFLFFISKRFYYVFNKKRLQIKFS